MFSRRSSSSSIPVTPSRGISFDEKPEIDPINRVLRSEGLTAPIRKRKIRKRSLYQKIVDWPSDYLLYLETTISLWTFDELGYPAGIALNVAHFVTRLPVFAAALPFWMRTNPFSRTLSDSELQARLDALQPKSIWRLRFMTIVSLVLIAISVGNILFLISRRKTYQFVLRQNPIDSPNARSAQLSFRDPPAPPPFWKKLLWDIFPFLPREPEAPRPHTYPIQELDSWFPEDYVWSVRIFAMYPPPLALMYHFLTPYNFVPFSIVGGCVSFTMYLFVHLYNTLLSDRNKINAEVLREYNAKFVHPRLSVHKREMGTDTDELELLQSRSIRRKSDWGKRWGNRTVDDINAQ